MSNKKKFQYTTKNIGYTFLSHLLVIFSKKENYVKFIIDSLPKKFLSKLFALSDDLKSNHILHFAVKSLFTFRVCSLLIYVRLLQQKKKSLYICRIDFSNCNWKTIEISNEIHKKSTKITKIISNNINLNKKYFSKYFTYLTKICIPFFINFFEKKLVFIRL